MLGQRELRERRTLEVSMIPSSTSSSIICIILPTLHNFPFSLPRQVHCNSPTLICKHALKKREHECINVTLLTLPLLHCPSLRGRWKSSERDAKKSTASCCTGTKGSSDPAALQQGWVLWVSTALQGVGPQILLSFVAQTF